MGVFGSESDISPAIGIRIPRLPVSVVFGVREPSYGCSDSSSSEKIRMPRMRHPSEHVSFPVRTTSTLMSMLDRLSRSRMRYPAESVLFVFLCLFQPVCVFEQCLATIFLPSVRGSRRVLRMRRGANTFPSHNRLPIPFSLVARPRLF